MNTAVKRILVLAAVALPVFGCGVKSAPEYPAGTSYPSVYPAPAPGAGPYTGSVTPPQSQPEPKRREGTTYSPLGFPLEYPNRPTY